MKASRQSRQRSRQAVVPLALDAIPRATYRVQLHRDFGFADVTTLVPYLAALGVSHVYCSPYLRARPGSMHGYDIVDHHELNPEIGTRAEFDAMVDSLARHGMSHVCDLVPNHMAIMGADNAWWQDVLEHGRASAFATFFDIDWTPQDRDLAGKVLVPVLGSPYGAALEGAELRLAFDAAAGAFVVRYFDHRFPVDPTTCAPVLVRALADAPATPDAESAAAVRTLVAALHALPPIDEVAPAALCARRAEAIGVKARLARLAANDGSLARGIDRAVDAFNGASGDAASFEALHQLLDAQNYRLAFWRVASDEINYRRFFDINELAALRPEMDEVFDATHAFLLELAAQRAIGGLRIDHPDGLHDPRAYFARLQRGYRDAVATRRHESAGPGDGIYVAIEKITAPHERLPEDWAVHGTTGYRFANVLNGVFVDVKARARLDRTWRAFVGDEAEPFERAAWRARRAVMKGALASELSMLTWRALRIARGERRTRDFTFNALREAIREVVASFPVYRSYVDATGASPQDRRFIGWAVNRARAQSRTSDSRIFDFLHALALGEPADGAPERVAAYRAFAMRFQQFTSPVAAKGVEDTAFYTFNRLVSLNEVGGDPDQFGLSLRAFHAASTDRAITWPHTMLATSTHDNKRSEDVRARIDVISEMPAAWRLAVRRFSRTNRSRKRVVDGAVAPSANDEYLLYQTLVGTLPVHPAGDDALDEYRRRIEQYMVKAAREAKVHTSWFTVDAAYEDALKNFVGALLRPGDDNRFLADLRAQVSVIAWLGVLNSLSMTLVKLTSPGVPDIYQGNEWLDWSLVDPDNRRPVDFAARRARLGILSALADSLPADLPALSHLLFDDPYDGSAKQWITLRALQMRRAHPALFAHGSYRRVVVSGTHAERVVAFARIHGDAAVVVIAGRLFAGLVVAGALPTADAWADTAVDLGFLASGTTLTNELTGESIVNHGCPVLLADVLSVVPGALLYCNGRRGATATMMVDSTAGRK